MTKPTPWPCDIGATTRGKGLRTTPADAEQWADKLHVYRGTHRVTMAEIPRDQVNAEARSAADAQMALNAARRHGTGEAFEDLDEFAEFDAPPTVWSACVMGMSVAADGLIAHGRTYWMFYAAALCVAAAVVVARA